MVVFVVKRYAVREAKKWRYAVRNAKIERYAVRKGGGGCHPLVFMFTAPPVFISDESILKVAAQLGQVTSFAVRIYSTLYVNVTLKGYRPDSSSDSINVNMTYLTRIEAARLQLKVFDKVVESAGFQVLVFFTIIRTDAFGEYQLLASNSYGTAKHIVEIIPEGKYTFSCFNLIN